MGGEGVLMYIPIKVLEINARDGGNTLYSIYDGNRVIRGSLHVYGLRTGVILLKGIPTPFIRAENISSLYYNNRILILNTQDFSDNEEIGQVGTEPIIHINLILDDPQYFIDMFIIFDFESYSSNEVQLFIGGLYQRSYPIQGRELISLIIEPTQFTNFIFRPVYPGHALYFHSAKVYRWVEISFPIDR